MWPVWKWPDFGFGDSLLYCLAQKRKFWVRDPLLYFFILIYFSLLQLRWGILNHGPLNSKVSVLTFELHCLPWIRRVGKYCTVMIYKYLSGHQLKRSSKKSFFMKSFFLKSSLRTSKEETFSHFVHLSLGKRLTKVQKQV